MAIKAINRFIIAAIILASICHAQVVQTFAALGAQNVFTATPNTFLGIAATSITDSGLTPGNCVQASTGGLLITASAPCGSGGGSGTVGSGTQYQLAIYANTGTTVSGDAALTDNGTSLNYSGGNLSLGTAPTVCGTAVNCIGMTAGSLGTMGSVASQGAIALDSSSGKWNVALPSAAPIISAMNYPVSGTGSPTSVLGGPTQYTKLRCETGLGDGLNAMAAGTYLQSFCYNDSGVTWTITGIKCYVDGGSSSTLNASGHTLGALLTGAITCGTGFVAGTQSANVLLTSGDYIAFTFVADGTAKQSTWVVSMTQ